MYNVERVLAHEKSKKPLWPNMESMSHRRQVIKMYRGNSSCEELSSIENFTTVPIATSPNGKHWSLTYEKKMVTRVPLVVIPLKRQGSGITCVRTINEDLSSDGLITPDASQAATFIHVSERSSDRHANRFHRSLPKLKTLPSFLMAWMTTWFNQAAMLITGKTRRYDTGNEKIFLEYGYAKGNCAMSVTTGERFPKWIHWRRK